MLVSLWLPIILSGVLLFVASFLAWVVLPHHKPEWKSIDDGPLSEWLNEAGLAPGQYIFPHQDTVDGMSKEDIAKRMQSGPWGTLNIWSQAPNMGLNMALTFVFFLVTSFLIAYLATMALEPGAGFMAVFRFTGTAGIIAHCCAGIPTSIWFKRKFLMDVVDGIAYGLITGLVFAVFWP